MCVCDISWFLYFCSQRVCAIFVCTKYISFSFPILFACPALLTVLPGNQTGTVVVTVTCNSHNLSSFENIANDILQDVDPFSPKVTLMTSLLLRHKPHVSPSFILLLNHHDNQATVSIQHGSGHFHVGHVTRDMPHPPVEVIYSPKNHEIVLVPSGEGRIKVEVRDLCLDVDRVEMVGVVVGGVYSIDVVVRDKVQVGSFVLACIEVMDSDGTPFPREQLK